MAEVQSLVWCHLCNAQRNGQRIEDSGELECLECHGTFVEALNQGVESFLSSSQNLPVGETTSNVSNAPLSGSQVSADFDSNAIVQQVLQSVLGINPATSSTSYPRPIGGGVLTGFRTAPMSVVIRQTTEATPRNLMSLLQSVANIRQHSFSPDPNALDNAQFEQFLHHILMNETSHSGAAPASQDIIAQLQREEVTSETNLSSLGDCCISQEPFEVGDFVISLTCGHKYKEEPITHWLKMHATCPVCRVNISA